MLPAHSATVLKTNIDGLTAMCFVSGVSFPRHAHDSFGIGLVTNGGNGFWNGRDCVEAGPCEVMAVNPGQVHDGVPLGRQSRAWRMLYVDPERLSSELVGECNGSYEVCKSVMVDRTLSALFDQMFESVTDPHSEPLLAEEHTLEFLHRLFSRYGTGPVAAQELSAPVQLAMDMLSDDIAVSPTLSQLATLLEISRFQVLRHFRRETGMTPHAYLMDRRIRRAQRMIASGVALAEVAVQVGFSDQSHLTRTFRRHLGVSPGAYRNACGHL